MILLTGGAGYIGAHTAHYLVKEGIMPSDIVVFDNLVYGHESHLPKGVFFIKGDILNRDEIISAFKIHKISSVIHFAAYAYVGESMQNPYKYFHNNITGGLNLLETMKDFGCKYIVFSSTCAVYGIPNHIPITENETIKPINPYGESKAVFERLMRWYDEIYGMRFVSLRYFNASGADFGIGEAHDPETHLIPLAIRAVVSEDYTLNVFGDDYDTPDGTCIRDYVHVTDLADAHMKALQYLKDGRPSDCFNIGTSRGNSVKEIIDIIKDVCGKTPKYKISKRREGDPPRLIADSKKAQEILGWLPKKNIFDVVSSAYEWHKTNLEGVMR
ncbi:MAG: UDP-glucose 4-epimerase GalE [Thermodesulfovibrionales bacterium]|nr:UDP-glucose 4-epimerase GalE [Thermodesulfovibrionales bacterium]